MTNPTNSFDPAVNPFQDGRYLRIGLHELADGTFVNASLATPLPVKQVNVAAKIVNTDMHQHSAVVTTLAVALVGDGTERDITVADATGFAVNDAIHINTGLEETTHPVILVKVGNVLTLDRFIDFAHDVGDTVYKATRNMAPAIGSLATPQEYFVQPPVGEVWYITRLLFSMTHATAGDLGKFGGIAALTNGILLRAKNNGQYGTFTNWKSNSDIKSDMFDVEFDARSGGAGVFGTSGRGSFYRTGAVVRLDGSTSDRIELYNQDDLSGLVSFTMKMQGHVG
jgi:hypothetical protein